ncbi:MAG: FAD-binding oxidoreductase [Rhodobacteraceae bacterium]|nr:FAD-binding oxidoreductase [Paracoccaceae bacterium]
MTQDWTDFAQRLAPVDVIDEPVLVKKRSRDFFWFSPILNAQLKRSFGDLVARPTSVEELRHVLSEAYKADVPVTCRGGGTGNYGQAVPLNGGLIVETTGMNRVLEIGNGYVRAEAGALMKDVNAALIAEGWEMVMFPSTQDIATIGGFIAGGSAGIGSVANGPLREAGNIIELKALSVEAEPREHVVRGDDVMQLHHAWGLNGVLTEITLRTVPHRNWIGCMATFDSYRDCYAAGYDLAGVDTIGRKLASSVDARICDYFPRLKGHIRADKHLLVALVPAEDMEPFRTLITKHGGHLDLELTDAEREAKNIPHVFDFAYNHTTLQVLKADRTATYQQCSVKDPADADSVAEIGRALGDDVWQHHEFARFGGEVAAFDLPVIWFKSEERLREIDDIYRAHGFGVYDAHSFHVESGGLHSANYTHLAWKKRLDPKGLLNPGKSRAWDMVKHLSPEEIEAKALEEDQS